MWKKRWRNVPIERKGKQTIEENIKRIKEPIKNEIIITERDICVEWLVL